MPRRKIPQSKGVPSMIPGSRGFDQGADCVWDRLEQLGWTVSDLAAKSGVPRVGLSNWLNGRRPLRCDYFLAVCRALNLVLAAGRAPTRE